LVLGWLYTISFLLSDGCIGFLLSALWFDFLFWEGCMGFLLWAGWMGLQLKRDELACALGMREWFIALGRWIRLLL